MREDEITSRSPSVDSDTIAYLQALLSPQIQIVDHEGREHFLLLSQAIRFIIAQTNENGHLFAAALIAKGAAPGASPLRRAILQGSQLTVDAYQDGGPALAALRKMVRALPRCFSRDRRREEIIRTLNKNTNPAARLEEAAKIDRSRETTALLRKAQVAREVAEHKLLLWLKTGVVVATGSLGAESAPPLRIAVEQWHTGCPDWPTSELRFKNPPRYVGVTIARAQIERQSTGNTDVEASNAEVATWLAEFKMRGGNIPDGPSLYELFLKETKKTFSRDPFFYKIDEAGLKKPVGRPKSKK